MQKPLSNPFRPAASRNSKPIREAVEFARPAVSETNFRNAHAVKICWQDADEDMAHYDW